MKRYIRHIALFIASFFVAELSWGIDLPNNGGQLTTGDYKVEKNHKYSGSERWNVASGQTVTIDLNGKTLDASELNYAMFRVQAGGKLIINGNGYLINSKVSCFYVLGELELNGGTIRNCQPSDGNGGAIDIQPGGYVKMTGGTIIDCSGIQGAGVYVLGEFEMTGGTITQNKVKAIPSTWVNPSGENLPNGISSNITLPSKYDKPNKDGNGNYEFKGGGVYVEAGKFTMSGGTIENNVSINGGGVYITDGAIFDLTGGTIKNNYATSSGSSYGNGGGIYLFGGSNCTINASGENPIEISGNRVTRYGGGIYIDGSTMTVTNCDVKENYASSGGGIAQAKSGTDQCQMTLENSDVTSNWAKGVSSDIHKGGGGIFVLNGTLISRNSNIKTNHSAENGGAFYVNNGDITLTVTNLEENTANNGGAIALMNGTFSIDEESVINKNMATENGGGLYVSNATTSLKTITCTGGSFKNNTAKNGGGIYVVGNPSNTNGKINLTFAANVEGNIASNGGGIYMSDRVTMTFGDGLIRSNSAIQPANDSNTYTTAKEKKAGSVAGVGGGIFMADNSTLSFSSQEMGIYGNSASNAGADICANGNGTTINLPNITGMDLKGFDVIGNDLYWVQDFFYEDTSGPFGVNLTGEGKLPGVRYEAALIQGLETQNYILSFTSSNPRELKNYLCLDLGYDLVFVTFKPVGLDGDEIIMLDYPEKNTDNGNRVFTSPLHYRKVSFNSEEPKVVGLPSGYWRIRDMGWNYKYEIKTYTDLTNTVQYDKSKVDSELAQSDYVEVSETQKTVIVKFDSKGGAEYIKESQHSKVNKMKVKK